MDAVVPTNETPPRASRGRAPPSAPKADRGRRRTFEEAFSSPVQVKDDALRRRLGQNPVAAMRDPDSSRQPMERPRAQAPILLLRSSFLLSSVSAAKRNIDRGT